MKLPTSLRIGPYTYEVILKKKVTKKDHFGEILYSPQTITIKEGLSTERTLAVLVHEVLHGLDEIVSAELSEHQITIMAPLLLMFLIENPEVLECLLSITSTSTTRMADSE